MKSVGISKWINIQTQEPGMESPGCKAIHLYFDDRTEAERER